VFVRQLVIMAGLTLTACAAPGVSGMGSFMSAMHPTPDFCASRGMTLDAATKQCTTTPPAAAPQQSQASESATGSLPQGAPGQSKSPPAQSTAASPTPVPIVQPTPSPPTPPLQPPAAEHRAAPSVPVEPNAVIYAGLRQDYDLTELAHYVRASGYRCDSISALQPLPSAHGVRLVCNHFDYRYAIEQRDGRSTVTVE
jgi:hypothetical protein